LSTDLYPLSLHDALPISGPDGPLRHLGSLHDVREVQQLPPVLARDCHGSLLPSLVPFPFTVDGTGVLPGRATGPLGRRAGERASRSGRPAPVPSPRGRTSRSAHLRFTTSKPELGPKIRQAGRPAPSPRGRTSRSAHLRFTTLGSLWSFQFPCCASNFTAMAVKCQALGVWSTSQS